MRKKLISFIFIASFLTSCISISVDSEETARANFVTGTLAPTKAGFVPATMTRTLEATQTFAVTASASCKDSAVLLRDVTIPDNTQVKAGEKFTKTWEFQNNGKCPWINYTLGFAAGDQMGAPLSALIQTTLPGEKVNVSVDLTAPSSDGAYTGYFTLNDASGKNLPIGIEKTFWVKIIVGSITPQSTSASSVSTPYVPSGGNSNCAYSQNAAYAQQLISLINQARASVNLHMLTVNAQLTSAAQAHSADMACNNFLDHTGSDGSWIGARLRQAGYPASSYFEIIAIGTPQNAMDQWTSDPPHWEAVLNPGATEIGVGYAYYENSDFGGYITVDFGGQ
jgi:uncharacterized protein YkwD